MRPLTLLQRYQIEHDIRLGFSNKLIAQALGCSVRTIERELMRCPELSRAHYSATHAEMHRTSCRANSAANHRTVPAEVWCQIEAAILRKFSPEQAKHQHQHAVSVVTIYRYLYRLNKQHLLKQLRHYKSGNKRRYGKMHWVSRAKPIHDRPKSVLVRDTMGHCETDSIVGKRNEPTKVVVIIDRALRYVRLGLARHGTAVEVRRLFAGWLTDERLPILSVTSDQGYEFSALPEILPGILYACDPGKPYQKGGVENMNKLIRQYIPKGKSLRYITQAKLAWIANELNDRIRKRHGWVSPTALLLSLTAATTT